MESNAQISSTIIGSFIQLLTGKPECSEGFSRKVEFLVSGCPIDPLTILGRFTRSGRKSDPLVVVQPYPGDLNLPLISLAARIDGKNVVFFECVPWLAPKGDRASLIPSDFMCGSFRFSDDFTLIHDRKAPKRNFDRAAAGIVRAFNRQKALEAEHIMQGVILPGLVLSDTL